MTELMSNDREEILVAGRGQCIAVVDTTSTVFIGIRQYNYMFVRNTGDSIVNILDMERRQITVRIESAEI